MNIKHEPEEIIVDETAEVSDQEVAASDVERSSKTINSQNICEFCGQQFQSQTSKTRHIDTIHEFECPTLSRFGQFYNFETHLESVHGLTSYAKKNLLLQCDLCLQTYFTKECLIRHMLHFHMKRERDEVFISKKKTYHPNKTVACNLCEHKYSCMSSLRYHKKNVHSGRKRSIICKKKMSGTDSLKSQNGKMQEIRLEQCKLCYRLVRNLTRHLTVFHSGKI